MFHALFNGGAGANTHRGLDVRKSQVVQAVVVPSGDNDIEAWQQWFGPAMGVEPHLDAVTTSGDTKFQSVDCKLVVALNSMIHNAGVNAKEVSMKLRQKSRQEEKQFSFVMGKEMEVMSIMQNLYALKKCGVRMMGTFINTGVETLNNMSPSDVPSDIIPKNCLYRKIKEPSMMKYDIMKYESFREGNPSKTYDFLKESTSRCPERQFEEQQGKDSFGMLVMLEGHGSRAPDRQKKMMRKAPEERRKVVQRHLSCLNCERRNMTKAGDRSPKEVAKELTLQMVGTKKRSHVPSILERVVVRREKNVHVATTQSTNRWRQRVEQRKMKLPSSVKWFMLMVLMGRRRNLQTWGQL